MYVYTCNICSAITTVEIMNISITPPNFLMSLCNLTLSIANLVPRNSQLCFLSLWISWHFLEFHTHEIIHYDWWGGADLASFTQQISIGHSFSLLNSILLYEYITISVSVDGHLVCIHFGAIINNTSECSATNVYVNMCFISLE